MNAQTTARTAGPWHTEHGCFGYVVDSDGDTVALCEESCEGSHGDANAAFIVQACNAHDDLVAALRNLQIASDAACVVMRQREALPSARGAAMGNLHKCAVEARAALAKAGAL